MSIGLLLMAQLVGSSRIDEGRYRPIDVTALYLFGTKYSIGFTAFYHQAKAREWGVEW